MNIYNNKKTLFYKLKNSCKKEWLEYTNHKFLIDLVKNELPNKNFKDYLIQDYIFLQKFLKILALSIYKSNSFEETNRSINFIKGIDYEIKLHVSYCKKWKIPLKSLNNVVVKKANNTYTDYVLKVGNKGNNLDIFSCLSPCIIGYGEIGLNLSKIKNWKKSKYSSWIKMYCSKEYQKLAKENIDHLDNLIKKNKTNDINKLKKNFKKSTILERNFWQCFV